MALCSSSWRLYKELRLSGLYPPGTDPSTIGDTRQVSVLELLCEAEDAEAVAAYAECSSTFPATCDFCQDLSLCRSSGFLYVRSRLSPMAFAAVLFQTFALRSVLVHAAPCPRVRSGAPFSSFRSSHHMRAHHG